MRVAVAAAFSFASLLVIYLLARACVACCCPAARQRSVYLGNVKMHYEASPLALCESAFVVLLLPCFCFYLSEETYLSLTLQALPTLDDKKTVVV